MHGTSMENHSSPASLHLLSGGLGDHASSGPLRRQSGVASPRCNSPWMEFYKDRIGSRAYEKHVADTYGPFLDAVHREWRPGEVSLEVGCGMGTVSKILGMNAHHTRVAIDLDQQMVQVARGNLLGIAKVLHGDMRSCNWVKANCIHGHGVLEHLDDLGIYRTLEAHQQTGARVAIHYVPGEGHRVPSFGDERLLPLSWWIDKWDATEAFTFNEGKDYVLIWRF